MCIIVNKGQQMRIVLLFVLFQWITIGTFGQQMEQQWKSFRNGSGELRVTAARELSKFYISEGKDSMRVIGEELFFYGIDNKYYPAIEQGKLIISEYLISTGRNSEGITTIKSLLSNIQERGDYEQACYAAKVISQGYRNEKDAKSTLFWANEAIKAAKKSKEKDKQLDGQITLAEAQLLNKKVAEAVKTYESYIRQMQYMKNPRALSTAHARLGDIYRIQGDLDKAERNFKLSYVQAEKAGLITPLGHAINNLGIIAFERGDTILARKQFQDALRIRMKAQDKQAICDSYYNLGDYHYYIGKIDFAAKYYKTSLQFAEKNNLRAAQLDALKALANLYKSSKMYEEALTYMEQHQLVAEQMSIDQSKDDEDIAAMELAMHKAELETGIENDKTTTISWRWEWPVIAILVLILVMLAYKQQPMKTEH